MQADVSPPPAMRRGTISATHRVAAELREMGFSLRVEREEDWDGYPACLIFIEGFDGVEIRAHCSEPEPDAPWRIEAIYPGAEMALAELELRDLKRTSSASSVVRTIVPYLSMTGDELRWL